MWIEKQVMKRQIKKTIMKEIAFDQTKWNRIDIGIVGKASNLVILNLL